MNLGIKTVVYREKINRHIFGPAIGQYFFLGLRGKERIKSLASTI